MGRKFANDTSPKKIIMSFCLSPDLAFKVKVKCAEDKVGLSVLLQDYLTEWVGKEKDGESTVTPKV